MKHPTSELYEAIQTKEDMKEVKEINEILEIISKFMTNQVTINKNINEMIKRIPS